MMFQFFMFVFLAFSIASGKRPLAKQRNIDPVLTLPPIKKAFALCISGGWRTLAYTAARYISFLEANPGTEVFLVLGRDNKTNISPDAAVQAFIDRKEVIAAVFSPPDEVLWPKIVSELGIRCNRTESGRMQGVIMQAYRLLHCQVLNFTYLTQFLLILKHPPHILPQRLVDDHARIKGQYTLVIRSRPDLLLPPGPPLNLTKVATEMSRATSATILPTPRAAYNMAFGKNKRPRITRPTHNLTHRMSRQVLLVPLCADWNGLNDQFAIGTAGAMRDYSERFYTWKRDDPAMLHGRCEGDSDRHTLANLIYRLHYTTVLRFVFEYTLLRDKYLSQFLSDPQRYSKHRGAVSGGANGFNRMVDVGTRCSLDPASVKGSKLLRRQREMSGRDKWTSQDLKCMLER